MLFKSLLSLFALLPLFVATEHSTKSSRQSLPKTSKFNTNFQTKKVNPIIFVPGFGGSQLHARLTNVKVPNSLCHTNSAEYYLLWLGVEYLLPYTIDCLIHYLSLSYVHEVKRTEYTEGVDIKIPGWGESYSVEWLSPIKVFPTSYFGYVVEQLVAGHGYIRNISARGAPYDFRKTPRENLHVINELKLLVERTYSSNGGQKVVLVAHSNGGLYVLHMLQHQTQAWKDRYIKLFISTSVPYGGSVKMLKAIAYGDNLNVPIVSSPKISQMLKTWPTSYYLLPKATHWNSTDVIAYTSTKNYTVNDYEQFFQDMGHPDGIHHYRNVKDVTDTMKPPGVEVHCVFSIGEQTPAFLDWRKKKFPNDDPDLGYENGDGTVNVRSLNACFEWRGKQKERVTGYIIQGWDHLDIVRSQEFIDYVINVVSK